MAKLTELSNRELLDRIDVATIRLQSGLAPIPVRFGMLIDELIRRYTLRYEAD